MHLGAVECAVFRRRTVFDLAEGSVKGRETGKAGLQGNLCDRNVGVCQQRFRGFDAAEAEIIIKIIARALLKQSGKMKLGKARYIGYLFQGDILCKMLVQIIIYNI